MVILKCALLLNLYIAHDGAHHQACVYGVYGGREVSWLIAGFASRSTEMAPQIPLAQWTPIAPTGYRRGAQVIGIIHPFFILNKFGIHIYISGIYD